MKRTLIFSTAFVLLLTTFASAQDIVLAEASEIPTTSIAFDETTVNFGKIEQDEIARHIFRFTNTGDAPLLLTSARGSCGCTVPVWSKEPIQPGGSGAVVVEFDSKGKMGPQVKSITITANTNPPQTMVFFKGEVYKSLDDENDSFSTSNGGSLIKDGTEKDAVNNISLYPNPTEGTLWINGKDAAEQAASIEIFNGNGQLIDQKKVTDAGVEPIQLDVSRFENGAYWLSMKVGDAKRINLPFVVAR